MGKTQGRSLGLFGRTFPLFAHKLVDSWQGHPPLLRATSIETHEPSLYYPSDPLSKNEIVKNWQMLKKPEQATGSPLAPPKKGGTIGTIAADIGFWSPLSGAPGQSTELLTERGYPVLLAVRSVPRVTGARQGLASPRFSRPSFRPSPRAASRRVAPRPSAPPTPATRGPRVPSGSCGNSDRHGRWLLERSPLAENPDGDTMPGRARYSQTL